MLVHTYLLYVTKIIEQLMRCVYEMNNIW